MELSVKKASLNDFEDLKFIQNHNEILLPFKSIEEDLLNTNKMYLIAKNYNLIIGYIACDINSDHADITALLVDKTFRNLSVATTLINHLIFYLEKDSIKEIFLEVRSSNTKAINLYTKLGFKFVSKRANYYSDDDAFVYKYTSNQ